MPLTPHSLADISKRLYSIESTLSSLKLCDSGHHSHSNGTGGTDSAHEPAALHQYSVAGSHSKLSENTAVHASARDASKQISSDTTQLSSGDIGHAVQTVSDTLVLLEAATPSPVIASGSNASINQEPFSSATTSSNTGPYFGTSPPPDVLDHGTLSQIESEISFRM